jgi:hypothetical protein
VSPGSRYLSGMAVVGLVAVAAGAALPGPWRAGWWLALGITLVVQSPLGWWLVTSVGTERFFAVWVLGMLLRLAVVGLTGLVLVPALGWPAGPPLLALVGFMVVSLVLEGIVSALQHSRAPVR